VRLDDSRLPLSFSGVRDRSARVRHLQLACDAGLDTCAITKALVESVFAKAAVKFGAINDAGQPADDALTSEVKSSPRASS